MIVSGESSPAGHMSYHVSFNDKINIANIHYPRQMNCLPKKLLSLEGSLLVPVVVYFILDLHIVMYLYFYNKFLSYLNNPQFALRVQELCEARHGFAKLTQEIASIYSVINHSMQLLASILRSHIWLRKAHEPEGQIVDCCTTGWSPVNIITNTWLKSFV